MPTRNVILIEEQAAFIDQLVKNGDFVNSDEVFFEAIKLLKMVLTDPKAKLAMLNAAIQQGIDSIEAGRYTTFDSLEALNSHFDKLADEAKSSPTV